MHSLFHSKLRSAPAKLILYSCFAVGVHFPLCSCLSLVRFAYTVVGPEIEGVDVPEPPPPVCRQAR